jgi:UDP-N-acetylglucosamine 2-epimerase (non-hydrolysing)
MKQKIALVVGTRPEVIKMAPVWFALQRSATLEPLLVSTGQHRQMLDQAFAVFGLKPEIDLALMQPRQTLPELTARVLTTMAETLRQHRPAAVLVQGDTTTVLSTAMAAACERVPVGHIEAGLRTYNLDAPWPEEMNRRLTDPISRWCFAPTEWSAANLRQERIDPAHVHVTGNTVVDALLWVRAKLAQNQVDAETIGRRCGVPPEFTDAFLRQSGRRFVLITGHRRESFGQGFEQICGAIAELARRYPDLGLLYPVHLNPNVQEPVRRILGANPRVALIPPVGYEDFIWLMDRAHFILSDSGGVQEEAPTVGKPVLVMRETTERPEGVEAGTCRLVGTDPVRILHEAAELLEDADSYRRRAVLRNPYGDGQAAQRIVQVLETDLGGRK